MRTMTKQCSLCCSKWSEATELTRFLASGGEEALKPAARSRFDLILTDVNMRGIDGFEVIRTRRSRDVETPIIIFVI